MLKIKKIPLALASIALFGLMTGCGGGGDDDSSSSSNNQTVRSSALSVNIKGASTLSATKDLVQASAVSNVSAASGRPLFTYDIVTPKQAAQAASSQVNAANDDDDNAGATNLLATDDQGNTRPALTSDDFAISVLYSVQNPVTGNVIVALDADWESGAQDIIGQNNCAIYSLNPNDNSYSCVAEGLAIQDPDKFYQRVNNNTKPIQFDEKGNIFFAATSIERECYDGGYCWINPGWISQLYRVAATDGKLTTITQDNQGLEEFLVLKDGNLVYYAYNYLSGTGAELTLWKHETGGTQKLNSDGSWGVEFFAIDDHHTIMWGDWNADGLRMATPVYQGVHKTTLSTDLFSKNAYPARFLIGDDEKLYAMMKEWKSECDSNNNNCKYYEELSVYQVLPADTTPKAVIRLPQQGWWSWMESTPIQITGGHLFYRDTLKNIAHKGANIGDADVIRMVRLEDRKVTTLLESDWAKDGTTAPMYDIYNWRVSGGNVHFSALNRASNTVVTGKVDTKKVQDGAEVNQYLTVVESASASGAASEIRDIEVIRAISQEAEAAETTITGFSVSPENVYSASLHFSNSMNKQSVADSLIFKKTNTADGEVDALKLWLGKTLHLVPALNGLITGESSPLAFATEYQLGVTANQVTSRAGQALTGDTTHTFTTRKEQGWYLSEEFVPFKHTVNSTKVAKLAVPPTSWEDNAYKLKDGSGQEIKVSGDFTLVMTIKHNAELTLAIGNDIRIGLSSWPWVNYTSTANTWQYKYSNASTPLANGRWQKYRIKMVGNTLSIEVANEVDVSGNPVWVPMDDFNFTDVEAVAADSEFKLRTWREMAVESISIESKEINFSADTNDTGIEAHFHKLGSFYY